MNELLNYLNNLGFEGINVLWLLVPLISLFIIGYIAYKIISFIVSLLIVILIFVGGGLYLMGDSDVNWKNLHELSKNTTDMLIVGKGDGCIIYAANRDVQEVLHINGWKKYFNACEKATERLSDLTKNEDFKKISKTSKESPECPMLLATNRSQLYLEMIVNMNSDVCSSSEKFPEIIERLNKEEKNNQGLLKNVKDAILDFIVKDIGK